jgi:putative tryptophan/tyrosine transport system substrate-binding protein
VKRRQFITLLGGAATWPRMARAQQRSPTPTIGWLDQIDPRAGLAEQLAAFDQALAQQGYVIGRNVSIEYLNAGGSDERRRALAAELVRRQVAVIVTPTGTTALAAKAATQSIPIVFIAGGDPVQEGLVASLNRPGGNLTGVATLTTEIAAKRLELLHDLAPKAEVIAALVRPYEGQASSDFSRAEATGFQSAALALGVRLLLLTAVTEGDTAGAVASAVQQKAGALLVGGGRGFAPAETQARIISLANRYSLPSMFYRRDAVAAGGLASYADDGLEIFRQAGVYVGRVLKGEKPADLPVQQSIKFNLVVNLKTAKSLGLTVSADVVSIADEVIE